MTSSNSSSWTRDTVCDRAAVVVIFLVALAVALTFRDYGLGWDDYTHAQYGELLRRFFASGFSDQRAMSFVNLYMYGGGFDLAADSLAKFLPLSLFETRRLAGGLIGVIGLIVTWRLGRRVGGPMTGLAAVILLAACPLFFGHMLINAKDAPFAVAMAVLLLGLVRLLEEYPRPGWSSVALFGLGLGLAIGSRTLGVLAGVSMSTALLLLVAIEARAKDLYDAFARLARFLVRLLPGVALGYVVMGLIWPWSVLEPLNPWRALTYFSHFFEAPWRERFDGELILVPDMPRSYVPTLLSLQLPEIFLGLGLCGLIGVFVAVARRAVLPRRRAIFLCVAMAAIFPVVLTIALRPAMYNGIRHFVFLLPSLAVLGGLAAAWLFDAFGRRGRPVVATVFILGIALPVIEMARLHPYEYTYFNRFVGGVSGAHNRYMLDYWGLSFKQASQALAARISDEQIPQPSGRHWKLAVCGPHRSPQVELGPEFDTSWDPKGADFALMLGVFYCRELDAPVIAEIRREGVLYARVYDLRGHNYDTLLNPYPERGF